MRLRPLGTTDVLVSEFIYGAGSIGGVGSSAAAAPNGLSREQGMRRLDEALELGVSAVDTADTYGGGESERTVGDWLRLREPERFVVATKTGPVFHLDGSRTVDLSGRRVRQALGESLTRLGHVDLHLTHAPDPATPVHETLTAFTEAREDGRIRAFGLCNTTAEGLESVLAHADKEGLDRPACVQNRLNLLDRRAEADLLPLAAKEGVGFTPFSPLAGGVLSERYLDGSRAAPGGRIAVAGAHYQGFHTPRNLVRVATLRDLAAGMGCTTSGIALRWLLDRPGVTAVIVSPSQPAQWSAVREALAIELGAQQRDQISAIFA